MPLLDIPNREQLDGPARDALESVLANLIGYLYTEHDDEGSHAAITADSVTVRAGGDIEFAESGSTISDDDGLVVESIGGPYDIYVTQPDGTRELRASFGVDPQSGQTGHEDQFGFPVSLRNLRLHPQSSYAASLGDTAALIDLPAVAAPNYSYYLVTSGSIEGIHTSGFTPTLGQRGQVVVVVNDKGSDMNIATLGIVSNQNKILGGPIILQDAGAAVFVYDDAAQGWRIVASNKTTQGIWTAYTPTFASSGTQPTNYTATGRYAQLGNTVHVEASVVCGASWTAGTGAYTFTLPVASPAVGNAVAVRGTALVYDSSTGNYYTAILRQTSTTEVQLILPTAGAVGAASPVAFAASDQIGISVTYERA